MWNSSLTQRLLRRTESMSHTWRLFQLTRGFRGRFIWAALLGLGASAAGIGRLALSGYALALVFQGRPFSTVVFAVAGGGAGILVGGGLGYGKEGRGKRTPGGVK